jgi:hypothetical protein
MDTRETPLAHRALTAFIVVAAFVAAIFLAFGAVQRRLGSAFTQRELLVLVALVVPFIAFGRLLKPHSKWTRGAWWLCVVLALDVVAMAVAVLAPTGGHPPIEASFSLWFAYAKVVLVPIALVALAAGALRGERTTVVALGVVCLAGMTLATMLNPDQPVAWFALLAKG